MKTRVAVICAAALLLGLSAFAVGFLLLEAKRENSLDGLLQRHHVEDKVFAGVRRQDRLLHADGDDAVWHRQVIADADVLIPEGQSWGAIYVFGSGGNECTIPEAGVIPRFQPSIFAVDAHRVLIGSYDTLADPPTYKVHLLKDGVLTTVFSVEFSQLEVQPERAVAASFTIGQNLAGLPWLLRLEEARDTSTMAESVACRPVARWDAAGEKFVPMGEGGR